MHLHSQATVMACLALGLAAGPQGCVVDVGDSRYEVVRVEKRFTVTGMPDLTLVTFDGSLEVRAWDQNEILVEIEKRGADRAEADAIEIRAEQTGNRVTIEARTPSRANAVVQIGASPSARIVATVPRRCNLTARSGDGSVAIERLAGRIDIETTDGSVRASDLEGSLRLHTGDGSVRVDGLNGPAEIETGDGSVVLSGRLAGLRLCTGDGGIRVRAESGSSMSDEWEVKTNDGGITIEIPEGFAADLDADAGDGRIRVDADLADPGGHNVGETQQHALRSRLNGGGKTLRIRTGDGTIVIKRS